MKYYLAKTDPDTYNIEDFAKEKTTTWNGVRNPQAVNFLKSMQKGDRVFIYHSQGQGTIRGLAAVTKNLGPDPKDERSWLVDFKFLHAYNEPYITIRDVKDSGKFADFALVRQGRLSVMEVPEKFLTWLRTKKLKV